MPLDRFVLILVVVVCAAGLTIWLGTVLMVSLQYPSGGLPVLVVAALVGYIAYRVLMDRLSSEEDDYYDGIEK